MPLHGRRDALLTVVLLSRLSCCHAPLSLLNTFLSQPGSDTLCQAAQMLSSPFLRSDPRFQAVVNCRLVGCSPYPGCDTLTGLPWLLFPFRGVCVSPFRLQHGLPPPPPPHHLPLGQYLLSPRGL